MVRIGFLVLSYRLYTSHCRAGRDQPANGYRRCHEYTYRPVGRSSTGLGLFAAKPIARKAYIASYRGRWIPTAQAQHRERRFGVKYMFEVNRQWTIDGSSRRNLGRYINHSCRPNAVAVLRNRNMVIVALRDVAPEERSPSTTARKCRAIH